MKRKCIICKTEFECGCFRERGASSITCSDSCSQIRKLKYNKNWNKSNPDKTNRYKKNRRYGGRVY